jgi:hypothetical protein
MNPSLMGGKAGFSAFFETDWLESASCGGGRLNWIAWYLGKVRYQVNVATRTRYRPWSVARGDRQDRDPAGRFVCIHPGMIETYHISIS